jgi:class 3 adenylate cyclase
LCTRNRRQLCRAEAIATHVLFAVDVAAPLVDRREPQTLARYGVTLAAPIATDDYDAPRRVAARLRAERRPGAIVPAATVAQAFNVVIYADVWDRFTVHGPVPLALDNRLLRLLSEPRSTTER